ncbi:MAG: L,D-transpeptidase family protein, partial [Atopobiaceae bacterium]|nr:L,D-transpeptidase family protein [Atopobiaceae bacterium]
NPWAWPLQIASPHALSATERIAYDEGLLSKLVTQSVEAFNKDATKPTNATASYDKDKHTYVIVPEKPGTEIDVEQVMPLVSQALSTVEPSLKLDETVLVQPTVLSDDPTLKEGVDKVNGQLGAVQKLKVGDNDVFEVGSDLIAGWLKVDEDLKTTVDTDAIVKWAQGDLSGKLDSVGAQRSYTRPDGKSITVSGGSYGWNIDGESLGKQIAENIGSGTQATLDVPMLQTAAVWNPGGQDWGSRYIDIDVSEQHVRLYDGNGSLIWESDCVTGNTTEKHDTPQGVYQINSNKESGDVVLEGPIDEKTNQPEYVSHVTYWMPFVWNAVALHDATWRYSFGGDIYQTSGSHGCVNLPYEKAEELFNICEVGDVVVVHW